MGLSQKRYLVPKESEEVQMRIEMGRKGTVLDAAGRDSKHRLSDGFVLEDVMQRKTRVPEEARTDQRTIHRWAPPGLKGYMGAEYSNDFYTSAYLPNGFGRGRVSEAERPSAGTGATRKSFREKRVEEEVAEQVALVRRKRRLGRSPHPRPLWSERASSAAEPDERALPLAGGTTAAAAGARRRRS
jgi:hypothetical protein